MPTKLVLRVEITLEDDGTLSWCAAEEPGGSGAIIPSMTFGDTDMTSIGRAMVDDYIAKISKPGGISTVKISRPGGVSALTEQLEQTLRELRGFKEIETPGGIFATRRDEFPE